MKLSWFDFRHAEVSRDVRCPHCGKMNYVIDWYDPKAQQRGLVRCDFCNEFMDLDMLLDGKKR